MAVIFGEEALSEPTIEQLFVYIKECQGKFVWGSNFQMWAPNLSRGTGVVLTHALSQEWASTLFAELHARGRLPYKPRVQNALFYAWYAGSSITWHMDYVECNSMTIYLSRLWDPNFGGYFCWKDWDDATPRHTRDEPPKEARMRLPVFNSYVYMTDAEWHMTTMTTPTAPRRLSLQMFFTKD